MRQGLWVGLRAAAWPACCRCGSGLLHLGPAVAVAGIRCAAAFAPSWSAKHAQASSSHPPASCLPPLHPAPHLPTQTAYREKLVRRRLRHVAADGRRRHTMRLLWWTLAMVPQVRARPHGHSNFRQPADLLEPGSTAGLLADAGHGHHPLRLRLSLLLAYHSPAHGPAAAADVDAAAQPHRLLHRLPHLLALARAAGAAAAVEAAAPRLLCSLGQRRAEEAPCGSCEACGKCVPGRARRWCLPPRLPACLAGLPQGTKSLEDCLAQLNSQQMRRLHDELLTLQERNPGLVFPRDEWPAKLIRREHRCARCGPLLPAQGGAGRCPPGRLRVRLHCARSRDSSTAQAAAQRLLAGLA